MQSASFYKGLLLTLVLAIQAHAGYPVNPNADDQISYDSFRRAIEADTKIQSIEEALKLVPKRFYDNHVLVYRSRSLQDASFLFPRAIAFGESGKFILTFNGNERQRGFNKLEMIQFRESTNRFEFREITFQLGKPPFFSEANPKKCLECHQSPQRTNVDPRPNWEPYNFWPGVYGSVDEEIRPVLKEGYEKFLRNEISYLPSPMERFLKQDMFLVDEQAQEQIMLRKFQEQIQTVNERYKMLPAYHLRNPLSLTKITAILNFRRIARIAREELGSLYDTYKYLLAGLGSTSTFGSSSGLSRQCGKLYFPDQARQKHLERLLEINSGSAKDYTPEARIYSSRFALEKGFDLIFEPLGISTKDWSMDFKTLGRFSFDKDRYTSPHDSHVHLSDAIEVIDPDLAKLSCEELAAQSNAKIGQFNLSGQLEEKILKQKIDPPKPQPLLERCISCHVYLEDGTAPSLPFDDFTLLKPLLSKGGFARGTLLEEIRFRTGDHAPNRLQMPPSGIFDQKQRDAFMKALEELAGNSL